MRRICRVGLGVVVLLVCRFWGGCSHEVGIRKATTSEKFAYSSVQISGGELSPDTVNLLGNYSLNDLLDDEPEQLIAELTKLFSREPRVRYLTALADVALHSGRRFRSADRDLAARYFLNAAMYSAAYFGMCDLNPSPYDPTGIRMMLIYNSAVSELFDYLRMRNLLEKSGFELSCVLGGNVRFEVPHYQLPIAKAQIRKIMLCADYRPENLTHTSRSFGIGAPLIIDIDKPVTDGRVGFAKNQTIPGTFVLKFSFRDVRAWGEYSAQVNIIDSSHVSHVEFGRHRLPLEQDLTTPLAYMVKDPPVLNFIDYTRLPGASQEMQGLYRFGPPDDDRIPVVLVHGLLSDTRTWLQMINTLQSDEDIGRNYQFLGFSYSSGNPIFYSAWMLRDALLRERARLVAEKRSTEKFDRMVIIGHSMGGLLTRLVLSSSGDLVTELAPDKRKFEEALRSFSPEERQRLDEIIHFEPLPFVKRAIFISTPHHGSQMAQTWFARLGASLIKIPQDVIKRNRTLLEAMVGDKVAATTSLYITGIDNLNPENGALKMLNRMPMSDKIVYHSIIGNTDGGGIPGGSDGIVPYASSHIDNVRSELVVKSGHSAQQAPLAIQEIRRILLEHLRQYPDSKITPPLLLFPDGGRQP